MKRDSQLYKKYLFNFSSSYVGGGLKRLEAYALWFHHNGGAQFIVNKKLTGKFEHLDNNKYYYVAESRLQKFLNRQSYLSHIKDQIGVCDVYYSYNIPMKQSIGKTQWFHLSNVLPFSCGLKFGVPIKRSVELFWLGLLIRRSLVFSDVISAESQHSLNLIKAKNKQKLTLSINGSDEELKIVRQKKSNSSRRDIAIVVGTYYHKNIKESYKVFNFLRESNPSLKLLLIGNQETIPQYILQDTSVNALGVLDHEHTIDALSQSYCYINTSNIENSWNAAAEGAYLSKTAYLSKIPPHLEFMNSTKYEELFFNKGKSSILKVERSWLNTKLLKTWDQVVIEMINDIPKSYKSYENM